MYVAGEPTNAADPALMSVRDPTARNRLVVDLHPVQGNGAAALTGKFDIVLGSP
jgi:protocatechuate 3,4-dioxygenase beta subunit